MRSFLSLPWCSILFQIFVFSLTVAGAGETLLTTHRTGVRLYKERMMHTSGFPSRAPSPSPAAPSGTLQPSSSLTSTGVWDLEEARETPLLRDAYLISAIDPLLHGGKALVSPYARYVCVATGSDASTHSVCVLSAGGAHFALHHELHDTNKIRCMHFAQLPVHALRDRDVVPIVVSVDEVGGVCIFDVEHDVAVTVERSAVHWEARPGACVEVTPGTGADQEPRHLLSVEDQQRILEDAGETMIGGSEGKQKYRHRRRVAYQVETGAATKVVVAGPCVELCNHCGNEFMSILPPQTSSRRSFPLTLVIASRGPVLVSEDLETTDSLGRSSAALTVTVVRVLYTGTRAIALWEREIVSEAAPEDLCDLGPALCATPYRAPTASDIGTGHALECGSGSVWLARPQLQLWEIRPCTGAVCSTSGVREATKCDSDDAGSAVRESSECAVQWLPLGRRVLAEDPTASWMCVAAVTDCDDVLLLGRDRRDGPSDVTVAAGAASVPLRAFEEITEAPCTNSEAPDGDLLEAWLDAVEPPPVDVGASTASARSASPPALCHHAVQQRTSGDYTVLHQLYSARSHKESMSTGGTTAASHGLLGIHASLRRDWLLLVMADSQTLQRVSLPFISPLTFISTAEEGGAMVTAAAATITKPRCASSPVSATAAAAAPLLQENRVSESVDRAWGATKQLASAWLPASSWWQRRSTSSEQHTDAEAEPAASPLHGFSLTRPLASALMRLAGDGTADLTTTTATATAMGEDLSMSVQPPCSPQLTSTLQVGSSPPCEGKEPSFALCDVTSPTSHGSSPTHSKQRLRPVSVKVRPAGSAVGPATANANKEAGNVAAPEGSMQEVYMREQLLKAASTDSLTCYSPITDSDAQARAAVARLAQLSQMEEPLERNSVLYAWEDGHDELYIAFSTGRDALAEREGAAELAAACREEAEHHLYDRYVLQDSERGVHSARFSLEFQSCCCRCVRHGQDVSNESRNADCSVVSHISFAEFFHTGVLPEALQALQDQDKCRFELQDLRLKQATALARLQPEEVVVFFQNEECVSVKSTGGARATWRPHDTFPVDDEAGSIVDLGTWNQHACAEGTAGEWTWADPSISQLAMTAAAREERKRVVVLVRQLQGWEVGSWEYASGWPPAGTSDPSWWSATVSVTSKVRRRRLTRTRVNMKIAEARAEVMKEHEAQLNAVKGELGL